MENNAIDGSYTQQSIHERLNIVNFIDLNELPEHEICESERQGMVLLDNNELENASVKCFEPFIGQCFLSEEEAYRFYDNFARKEGFSIRKGRFFNKNGKMIRRDFFCHREGNPDEKIVDPSKEQRNRSSARCGCKAFMRITLKKSNDIFPEEWQVTLFTPFHNHDLLSPTQVRFLPSYRTISKEDEQQLLLYKDAGLSDLHNFFGRIQRENLDNDAIDLLEYCKRAKMDNPNFEFSYTIDAENRLENIFWSPAHCFDLYQEFGDSTGFDTTYRVNSYDMPFGIFIGIDNHGRTILFGCALIRNERVATFRWLMKTFVTLMNKPPVTIITDQDLWLTEAISKEMPFTKHAFCIWHITSKFSGWFTTLLREWYSAWCAEFYRLYRLENVDDFEQEWPIVVSKFNLQGNKHVQGLYEIKENWVPAYLRGYFFGGMTTTGRCESINSFVKRFTTSRSCLTQLIKQVDLAIEDVGLTQLHHSMLDTYRGSTLRTLSPLEEQVQKVFTVFSFKKFQEEFERATQYKVSENDNFVFIVQHYMDQRSRKHSGTWSSDTILCSCKHFEFWGIICRHVLSVFMHKDCIEIPPLYLPVRWCRDEFHSRVVSIADQRTVSSEQGLDNQIVNLGDDYIANPPISKTKGRPKHTRERGGKEVATKQGRSCTLCKKFGHNITTCPDKENVHVNIVLENDRVNTITKVQAKKRKKDVQARDEGVNPVFLMKR